jgi:hypothetical protein
MPGWPAVELGTRLANCQQSWWRGAEECSLCYLAGNGDPCCWGGVLMMAPVVTYQ